jgi:hypothetical protein
MDSRQDPTCVCLPERDQSDEAEGDPEQGAEEETFSGPSRSKNV